MDYRDPVVAQQRVRRLLRRRRRARVVKGASVVVLVLIVAGGAAIGIDRAVVFGRHLWAEHHRHHAALRATTTTTASTTTTTPGPPRCAANQVSAYLFNWIITGGTLYEVVAVNNSSGAACTLVGYVGLSASAPGGGTLPSPTQDVPTLGAASGASTAPAAIAPGQRGWFEFSYPVECSNVLVAGQAPTGAPGECYQGQTLGVVLPGAPIPLDVAQPLRFTYGTAGFDVGPFASTPPPTSPPVG